MAIKLDNPTPGIFGILFGIGTSVVLGGLLAVLHLIGRPVEVVRTLPAEPVAGVLYFEEGAPGSTGGARWKAKVQRIVEKLPGENTFSEGELNAWSGTSFKKAELEEGATPTFAILAGLPNFRFVESELQVGMVNDVFLFGFTPTLVVQARGGFTMVQGGGWKFEPSQFYFGGLPVHKVPALVPLLAKRFVLADTVPEEIATVMQTASLIEVKDKALHVVMP